MPIRLAINGFGRIGRAAFKVAHAMNGVQVVAINDLSAPPTLAHLLRYDTLYGRYDQTVVAEAAALVVGKEKARSVVTNEKDPSVLPWKKMGVDVVLECTGRFTDKEGASAHLKAGAKKVVISAPAKGGDVPTVVLGVNDSNKLPKEAIVSNASCTTNCIGPVAEVIHHHIGVVKATMTTIHSYTSDQNLHDGSHKDLRRARAAALNIVPTTTGAAIATTEVVPELKNKFDGLSIRVPTPVVSLADFTFLLKRTTTAEEVNRLLTAASKEKRYQGILGVTSDPVVSSDFIGSTFSSIVDLALTSVVDGDLLKVIAWYDNEWGYSHRLVQLAALLGKK
ncbi:type I glyceraldehyde-3-phosphate dehydrogenase [Candidatus Uhrbacteria bacterium]|nr:type I glyceraldehyde-3-phosphate dehydrogenase [Candidatus Uhrbacteria bacterium]